MNPMKFGGGGGGGGVFNICLYKYDDTYHYVYIVKNCQSYTCMRLGTRHKSLRRVSIGEVTHQVLKKETRVKQKVPLTNFWLH